MTKEFGKVFIILAVLSLYLVSLAFLQSPFNSFEDDASWLIPSLASDMSSLSWAEQLARDVGERGAISLNMMLRFLYLIFEGWPTGYILFGIFAHTVCTSLLFVALRKCGVERRISLITTLAFFISSLQFHAIFWVIGVQHVLAVSSILITCTIAHHIFRFAYCRYQNLNAWHYAAALLFLMLLGINRASIVINLFAFSLFFIYYALKLGGNARKGERRSSAWRLYGFYATGMLAIPAFSFYQLAHQGEGWQVISALQHTGIPITFIQYFSSISHLYLGLIFSLILICAVTSFLSIHASRFIKNNFATLCYFSGIAGIFTTLLFLKKTRYVLPAILENFFFIPDVNIIQLRWSPIDVFRFESMHTTETVNTLLCLALLLIFVYARPKKDAAKLLGATFFLMIIVGLAYFNSLTKPPLSLNAIPSRYAYYFTPSLLFGVTYSIVRLASSGGIMRFFPSSAAKLSCFFSNYLVFRFASTSKCGSVKISAVLFMGYFLFANATMLEKRLDYSKVDAFYHQFANYRSFLFAESIASWKKSSGHIGDVSVNLYGYKGQGWYFGEFMPPADSEFDPFIFNTQAFLTQIIGRKVKLHSLYGSADIMLCGGLWYGRTVRPSNPNTAQCESASAPSNNAPIPNAILQENGVELQLLKPQSTQESVQLSVLLRQFHS